MGSASVAELWSVHAAEEACDLVMRAPDAGRVASDEVIVRGPIADDLRAAVHTVDAEAVIRECSEGWAEIVLSGPDARSTFARVSDLPLPDGGGYAQGDVARVAARVFAEEDSLRVFVRASWGSYLADQLGRGSRT
jgi:sarcosine oxidase gamma subunit